MDLQAKNVFSDTVKRLPVVCVRHMINEEIYVVGIYEKDPGMMGKTQHIVVLHEESGIWHCEHECELDDVACYSTVESYELVDEKYLYIERTIQHAGTMFQGTGCVEFVLYEINTNVLNRFWYDGLSRENGTIQGRLRVDKIESADKRFCEQFLKQKYSESNHVYRTPPNYDLDDPVNYLKKWEIQNADFYNNEHGTVKFSFYNEPVSNNDSMYTIDEVKASGTFCENDLFIVFLCVKGTLVAYRKSDRKYFVVVVPQGWGGGGGWGMRSFIDPTLSIEHIAYTRCGYEQYEVNLETGYYHRSDFQEQ